MYIRKMYIIHAIWRFPKSWGTPKSSTSWMSILDHGDLGIPPIARTFHILLLTIKGT